MVHETRGRAMHRAVQPPSVSPVTVGTPPQPPGAPGPARTATAPRGVPVEQDDVRPAEARLRDLPPGDQPTGELPTGEQPTGEQPTGEQPTGVPAMPRLPGRRRAAHRPWWLSLLAGVLGLVAGVVVFLPHAAAWIGHNGDHYYYASTALQYAGTGYEQSLQVVADYFDYPYSGTQLDLGYLNPAVAPLIYPRVMLGLLALPTVSASGIEGIWFPGLLCGGLSVLLLMVLAVRRVGRIGLVAIPVLVAVTRYAPEFMFGIYAEAPLILATTLVLLTFPTGRSTRTWWHAWAAAGLVPLMMVCRQVPLLPLGMALGGFVWAWVGSRRLRNPWLPYALTVPAMTVASYALLTVWAPYDALPFLYAKTGTSTLTGLVEALPDMWSVSIGTDWTHLVATDLAALVVVALGLVGFVLVLRNPLAGVFLGTLASGAATELLNGQPNDFRYLSPSLPVVLLLAALTLAWAVHQLPRLLGQVVRDWPGAALLHGQHRPPEGVVHVLPDGRLRISRALDPARAPTRWGPLTAAVGAWAAVALVIGGTVALHRPAPVDGAATEQVSAASLSGPWPLTVAGGTLICAGDDYQMWFVTPAGRRYALSGSAMARSLRTPRVTELAPGRPEFAWPAIKPLLSEGMRLCGSPRAFQTDAR